jgi:hypothetical protein
MYTRGEGGERGAAAAASLASRTDRRALTLNHALAVTPRSSPSPSPSESFAVQAGTEIAANGVVTRVRTGSIGVAPGTSITGNIVVESGTVEDNSSASIACASDELTAYAAAKSAVCPPGAVNTLTNPDLGGRTFLPGVYCAAGGYLLINAGIVTLNGLGDPNAQWIFQTATSLVTSTGTSFILEAGAQSANVFWQIGSSATIGYSSSFVGTVLAYASITFDHDAEFEGRALAQAAVTFAGGDSLRLPIGLVLPAISSTGAALPGTPLV